MGFRDDQEILNMMLSPASRNEGYRHLVSKYKEKLYWHIRRMVTEHEDADDVLQNTFLKVVKNIDHFKSQSSLYTWLYRIASNESLNFIQSRKNKSFVSLDSRIQYGGSVEGNIDGDLILNKLAKAIESLPDKQKLVFNLRYYDEMPYHSMAEVTDTSVGALKASYHHAVKKIEEYLKADI
ncbi:MAG: sigma-70 family RNA polymerase sigma factor [Saprospiraceae bacterium]